MPAVARVGDIVLSKDGFGTDCVFPGTVPITVGNPFNVTANGLPIPIVGLPVPPHPVSGCGPDLSVLTTGSATVTIGGLPAARIGSLYGATNIIITGSPNVFIGA